jgi:hypothetical protein
VTVGIKTAMATARKIAAEIGCEKNFLHFQNRKNYFEKIWADTPTRPGWELQGHPFFLWDFGRVLARGGKSSRRLPNFRWWSSGPFLLAPSA